jgi:hypothetical protein
MLVVKLSYTFMLAYNLQMTKLVASTQQTIYQSRHPYHKKINDMPFWARPKVDLLNQSPCRDHHGPAPYQHGLWDKIANLWSQLLV